MRQLREMGRSLRGRGWRAAATTTSAAAISFPAIAGAASVEVANNNDVTNGDTASIAALQASPGPDGISLREAILAANNTAGVDDITFADALSGQSIVLAQGQLELIQGTRVDASALADNIVVDANDLSRVMLFSGASGDLALKNLTLQNGYADDDNGGGIWFQSSGTLELDGCEVRNNYAYYGGGIYSTGPVDLRDTVVSGNKAEYGGGIGIYSAGVTLMRCEIRGNTAYEAGGIYIDGSGSLTASDSHISENVADSGIDGVGGIDCNGPVELTNCTLDRNTSGLRAYGLRMEDCTVSNSTYSGIASGSDTVLTRCAIVDNGGLGLFVQGADVPATLLGCSIHGNGRWGAEFATFGVGGRTEMVNCTVAENGTDPFELGGGVYGGYGSLTMVNCTVSNHGSSLGVYIRGGTADLDNCIAAGNETDIGRNGTGTYALRHCLIGDNAGTTLAEAQTPDANGNLIGSAAGAGVIDPMLGSLQDNGGLVLTQAPLAGSPVIDAGDNALLPADTSDLDGDGDTAEPLPLDARGAARVNAGTVDMGAVESGTVVADPYQTWIAGFYPGVNDPLVVGPAADPDGDGLPNALAFVLGASPVTSDPALLPTAETGPGGALVFTFRRADASAYLNPRVQFGTDLDGWETAVDGEGGVTVAETDDGFGPGVDRVVVTVPAPAGGRLFARLVSDLP